MTKSVREILIFSELSVDPDVGVDDDIAQFYFMQLISAMVSFLTISTDLMELASSVIVKGVAHRGRILLLSAI